MQCCWMCRRTKHRCMLSAARRVAGDGIAICATARWCRWCWQQGSHCFSKDGPWSNLDGPLAKRRTSFTRALCRMGW